MSPIVAGPPAREPVWWVRPDLVAPPAGFRVLVDTREQRPLFSPPQGHTYALPPHDLWAVAGTLGEGDYSLLGHEDRVRVERKSLSDLYGSVSAGRERFEREFARLAEIAARPGSCVALLVEGTYRDVIDPDPEQVRSAMNPVSVEGTVIAWCQRCNVWPLFVGTDRRYVRRFVFRWLAAWFRQHGDEL